ncbi:MAG TPA: DUF2189 domain-containing protein [Rhodopila sp.]|uniref:DUF2189 domain-containing protein n=1 Tax=Rhodopila sp. TaxID=2480087 RepID=UPI002B5CEF73|nr:DUF2189 domain-containing protein [Rhodopila sp.]HVY17942.1 DUF2189 domain-containing protein [Rhodopila sp.]
MIKTPPGWSLDVLGRTFQARTADTAWTEAAPPAVRRISLHDIGDSLRLGWQDFQAARSDVVLLCLIYPIAGLLMARAALGHDMLPLVFPLASGFALLGPLFGVGLNEMSRRRERGLPTGWGNAFDVLQSPSFGAILLLGLVLAGMFVFWLVLSQLVYMETLGPKPPVSIGAFGHDILLTSAGWAMAAIGIGVGFLIALVAFCISVVSFPLLLDQPVTLETAIRTSVRAVRRNPVVMMAWGAILAGGLALASLPLLLGLIVVLPVFGHATWHLYRRTVGR